MTYGASDHLRAAALALAAVFLLLAAFWWVETSRADAMRNSLPVSAPVAGAAPEVVFDEQAGALPSQQVSSEQDRGVLVADAPVSRQRRHRRVAPLAPQRLVAITRDLQILERPGGGRVLGTMPARSRYLSAPMTAWVMKQTAAGDWGFVTIPWGGASRGGWIPLAGLQSTTSSVQVRVSLSERRLRVWKAGRVVVNAPAAVGAASSPSPTGRFFVTDPVPVPASQPQFGGYAFGISAIQPNTPPGWTGGNQMAIHGTDNPGSIGTAASAGCLRVSARVLARLRTLIIPGTPVMIEA